MSDFWYLATPYSKYEDGLELAFQRAAKATGYLLKNKVNVYSPIAHTHPIAIYGEIDPLDYNIWLPFDEIMMAKAKGMIVYKMKGWEESYGVDHEIKYFTKHNKPIVYMDEINYADAFSSSELAGTDS